MALNTAFAAAAKTSLEELRIILEQEDSRRLEAEELERLTCNLQDIRFLLNDANRRYKEADFKTELDHLKLEFDNLADFLDRRKTEILKSQVEGSFKPTPKVPSFIRSFCFCGTRVGQSHDSIVKTNDIIEKLHRVGSASVNVIERVDQCMPLALFVNTIEVIGRNQERNGMIKMLLDSSRGRLNPDVIFIIGKGGIGKTALAKLVYNHNEVKTHFEKRIWVCVSHYFDVIRIANAILESLTGVPSNLVHLRTILEQIQQLLEGKRFLLVLIDVWNVDSLKWEQLKHSLQRGSHGSKILLTTVEHNVASELSSANKIQLGALSMEDCWSIISQIAFFGRTKVERESLEDIGRKIAHKCKGLPLAAKIIGGVLRHRKSRTEWQSFLDSDVWETKETTSNGLLAPLWLSYYDLPLVLRQCFSHCAIFPRNSVVKVDKLIELWIAQGFLGPRTTQTREVEISGEEYFRILSARFFFHDFGKDDDGYIVSFRLHHIVHDFVQNISKKECFSIEIDGIEEQKAASFGEETRHLRMVLLNQAPLPTPLYNLKNLHGLFIQSGGSSGVGGGLPRLFDQLTRLRSLDLSNCDIKEIPSTISRLMHLRQLILSYNKELKEVPERICVLYNLQILDISFCQGLVKLPHGIGNLVNLRHLHNKGYQGVLPTAIKRLSCLRTLDNFHIGLDSEAGACSLSDLKNLDHLGGYFCISGLENANNVSEAMQAQLGKKTGITTLELHFGSKQSGWRKSHNQELIEVLEPPTNLKSLLIEEFQGSTIVPSWLLSLTNLRKLSLKDCNCEHLPPLGALPSLELLVLWNLDRVKTVGVEFLGTGTEIAFPKLTKLLFLHLDEWEKWDVETGMPCLRSLFIYECPKLKSLPDHLLYNRALEEFDIINCPNIYHQKNEKGGNGSAAFGVQDAKVNTKQQKKEQGEDMPGKATIPIESPTATIKAKHKEQGKDNQGRANQAVMASLPVKSSIKEVKKEHKGNPDEATLPFKATAAASKEGMQGEERHPKKTTHDLDLSTASKEKRVQEYRIVQRKYNQDRATQDVEASIATSKGEVQEEDKPGIATHAVKASETTDKPEVSKEEKVRAKQVPGDKKNLYQFSWTPSLHKEGSGYSTASGTQDSKATTNQQQQVRGEDNPNKATHEK